jgi:hypothetical protein
MGSSVVTAASSGLSCDPAVLTSGGVLTLHFKQPHPAELSIEASDGTACFLVYEPNATMGVRQTPLVEKAAFRTMRELKLGVSTANGVTADLWPRLQ